MSIGGVGIGHTPGAAGTGGSGGGTDPSSPRGGGTGQGSVNGGSNNAFSKGNAYGMNTGGASIPNGPGGTGGNGPSDGSANQRRNSPSGRMGGGNASSNLGSESLGGAWDDATGGRTPRVPPSTPLSRPGRDASPSGLGTPLTANSPRSKSSPIPASAPAARGRISHPIADHGHVASSGYGTSLSLPVVPPRKGWDEELTGPVAAAAMQSALRHGKSSGGTGELSGTSRQTNRLAHTSRGGGAHGASPRGPYAVPDNTPRNPTGFNVLGLEPAPRANPAHVFGVDPTAPVRVPQAHLAFSADSAFRAPNTHHNGLGDLSPRPTSQHAFGIDSLPRQSGGHHAFGVDAAFRAPSVHHAPGPEAAIRAAQQYNPPEARSPRGSTAGNKPFSSETTLQRSLGSQHSLRPDSSSRVPGRHHAGESFRAQAAHHGFAFDAISSNLGSAVSRSGLRNSTRDMASQLAQASLRSPRALAQMELMHAGA